MDGLSVRWSNWERGYDVGYYEGIRNATATLITLLLNGIPAQDAVKKLAELRDAAHENAKMHKEDDE